MKYTEAKEITSELGDARPHSFGTAIIQKRAPGAYTYAFGNGSLAIDAVVSFLLSDATNPNAMQRNCDDLSNLLLDNGKIRRIWGALFASQTQNLTVDQHLFSSNDSSAEIAKVLGGKAISGLTATMNEILIEAFAGTSFVSRSEGYSFRELRHKRFPTADDLEREAMLDELVQALKSEPIRISFSAKRFTPTFLRVEFEKTCNRLGRLIAKLGYNYDAIQDAMYVVYTGLNDRGGLHSRLPAEVVNSGEYAELTSNLTFVLAAYERQPKKARDGAWNMRNNMAKVLKMINLSERYEIVSLNVAVGHMRYTPVVDARSNLLGGVLSYSAPIKHRTDVALFHQQSAGIPLLQAIRLERYTESFGSLIAPIQGWDIMGTAHDIVESIVSVSRIKETDDNPRSTLFVLGTLTSLDIVHLAVVQADQVYLPKDASKSAEPLDQRLIFEKDLAGLRLYADEIPFEGRIQTRNPHTLILGSKSVTPELSFDMTGQFTADFVWDTLIVNEQSEITWDFNGATELETEVGGSPVKVSIDMTDITRNIIRETARMMSQPFTAPIVNEAISAIHDAMDWVNNVSVVKGSAPVKARLGSQVSHQLHSVYERLASSDLFQGVLDSVIRRLAKTVSPDLRDETYMSLEQMNYRLMLSANLVGYVYQRLQLMGEFDGQNVHTRSVELWKENDFFNTMIGAARATRVSA